MKRRAEIVQWGSPTWGWRVSAGNRHLGKWRHWREVALWETWRTRSGFLPPNAVHGINCNLSGPPKERADRQVLVKQGPVDAITGRRQFRSISFFQGRGGRRAGDFF